MLSQNQTEKWTFEMKLHDFFLQLKTLESVDIYMCVFVVNISWNSILPGHCVISAVYIFPPVQNMVDFSGWSSRSTKLSSPIRQLNFEFWQIQSQNLKFQLTQKFVFIYFKIISIFLFWGYFLFVKKRSISKKSSIFWTGSSIYVCILVLVGSISRS